MGARCRQKGGRPPPCLLQVAVHGLNCGLVDRDVLFCFSESKKSSGGGGAMLRLLSRFLRAPFQFSKRAPGEATKFGRSGVKLLGVVGAARLECGEPAAESSELIR